MITGWEQKRLAEVIETVATIDPARAPESPFKYVDVSSVSNTTFEIEEVQELLGRDAPSRARRHIKSGDVLFATIRPTLRRIAVVPESLHGEVCSTGYFVFRPKPFLDGRYLFYYLMTPRFMGEMEKLQTGASYPAVNDAQVKSQLIQFPQLKEQKRIVAFLDETFDGIAKATSYAERNLANARELFNGLLRNSFLDQSEWTVFDLGDRVRFIDYRGKTPPKTETGVRLITAKNVKMGFIQRSPEEFVDPDAYDGWMTRGLPRPGDVLFTTEAPLGNVAQLDTNEKVMIGQRLITMQPEEGFLQRDFLKWLLMSPGVQASIWEHATGATVQGIKAKLLKTIALAAPDVHVQARLSGLLEDAWQAKGKLEFQYREKVRRLSELKSTLLTRAFSGQLTSGKAIAA